MAGRTWLLWGVSVIGVQGAGVGEMGFIYATIMW